MPLTTTNFSNILKTDYHGPIVDQLENASAFLSRMDRKTENTGGNFFYEPLRTLRTGHIGTRNEGDIVPGGGSVTPGNPGYDAATFVTKSMYAALRITGKAMRVSRGNAVAFAQAQVQDMEDTVTDTKKDVNRQLFSDGSGELAQIVAVASGTPNTVSISSINWATNPSKFLYAGMLLDIANMATGAIISNGQSLTVADVPTTNCFTYTGTAFTANTTLGVYREGTTDLSSASTGPKDIFGLLAVCATQNPSAVPFPATPRLTSNYGFINRGGAGKSFWRGQVLDNGGTQRPLTLNLLQQGEEASKLNAGGEVTFFQTNYPIYRIYGVGLSATKNADMAKMTLDGGFEALEVNGKPFVPDVECPDNVVFCLDENTFKLGVTGDWEWVENNGSVLTRLPGYDNYEAVMVRDLQLICRKPRSSPQLRDIAHS